MNRVSLALFLLAGACLTYGAWLIVRPAAFIVAGVLVAAGGVAAWDVRDAEDEQ